MMRRSIALLLLGAWGLTAHASAQCFSGPDGLTGPCWQPTNINLPGFDDLVMPGEGICWSQCRPQQLPTRLVVGPPISVACGRLLADLSVIDGTTGLSALKGRLVLDYTRTWDEGDVQGTRHQVYRFAAKVDLELDDPGADKCLIPECLRTERAAFYYGYLDYAYACPPAGAFQGALVLFHNCDEFIHHPTSSVPGTFHPDRSYALVGPSTATNPFVAAVLSPPAGAMRAEAVRNVPSAAGIPCTFEDPISAGSLTRLGEGCGCQFAPAPPQLTAIKVAGRASCVDATGAVTTFLSAKTTPTFPWFHMMTTSIGNWTTPFGYPGEEVAWVNEVPIFYRDTCAQSAFGEVYYGGSTSRGWDVATGGLTQNFTDLASNTSWRVPGKPPKTFMGSVLQTRNLIYYNVP